jgi:molybdopterin-guanine dinucleotide biosynthesis protein A
VEIKVLLNAGMPMRIVGAVIAGGKASRLGGEKAFLAFSGSTLLETVVRRFLPQVDELALNLRADRPTALARLPVIHDIDLDIGPLAGVMACLTWAESRNAAFLATVPCDTPFLPLDLVAQLARATKPNQSSYACDERSHYLCALWPTSALDQLRTEVKSSRRLSEVHSALKGLGIPVHAAPHAFLNINTQEDVRAAEAIIRQESARDA